MTESHILENAIENSSLLLLGKYLYICLKYLDLNTVFNVNILYTVISKNVIIIYCNTVRV